MKKIIFVIFYFIISINVFGQAKEITEKEYNSVESIVTSNFEKVPYREITTNEDFENGKVVRTENITEENLPPDKLKWTSVEKTNEGTNKSEMITIGYTQYIRENGGKWTKESHGSEEDPTEKNTDSDNNESNQIINGYEAPNHKKYTLEEGKLNNQSVRIYTVVTVYDDSPETKHTFKRWIDSKNMALQTEELETDAKSGQIISRSFSKYEYNPKDLKIEAPIK